MKIRLRKQVNSYELKLEKDAEFLHLELARKGFHTISGRPLTLHPQLRKKIDNELKLQDILPVSESKTSSSTQQTPNDKSLSKQSRTESYQLNKSVFLDAYKTKNKKKCFKNHLFKNHRFKISIKGKNI